MKLYINCIAFLLFTTALVSCNSADSKPLSDSVYQQYGSPFDKMPAKEDAVIYQVNIRAFSPSGTIKGVQDRLADIQQLGVNVIYLMPITPNGIVRSAGGLGSPYSVKDYKSVSTEYGSLEDLRVLVAEAHKMNIAVLLDWVANHTSWDNEWITAHPEWYQQDANGNIIIPPGTNYNDVAQLDYTNTEMRKAMIDAMSYWVYTANIDGFRCDYADFVPQNFWTEAIAKLRTIKNQKLLMLAEGTKVTHFEAGFDYTFGFGFFGAMKKIFSDSMPATSLQDANAAEYANNYKNSQRIVRYTTNHDVAISDGSPIELFGGKKGSVATFLIAAYMKSIPMIYNGQEIGYASRIPFFTHTPIDWTKGDADVLAEYKKIIAFRNSSNAIKKGTYKGYSSDAVCAFTMETETDQVLVFSNLTNKTVNYIVPASLIAINWKDAYTSAASPLTKEISLAPYQYLVLKN